MRKTKGYWPSLKPWEGLKEVGGREQRNDLRTLRPKDWSREIGSEKRKRSSSQRDRRTGVWVLGVPKAGGSLEVGFLEGEPEMRIQIYAMY